MKVHANAALGPAGRLALVEAIESGMTQKAAAAAFCVVIASLDAHDARFLSRTKAGRMRRPEHDRYLAEDVPGVTLTDDALDTVNGFDRLGATLEHGEDRALVALVHRVLAGHEAEIRRRVGETLSLGGGQRREDGDRTDFLGAHHLR